MTIQEMDNLTIEKTAPPVAASEFLPGERPSVRHVISLLDLTNEEVAYLIDRAVEYGSGRLNGHKPLTDKIIGIYFRKPSTRTRSAFAIGAMRLGAKIMAYGPNDLQITTGETIADTARVLSGYMEALVIRTNESMEEMRTLAAQNEMAVINAMSDNEHPTQAIADLSTMKEHFGRLNGLHILYLGEGNNSTAALAFAVAKTPGMTLTIVTPPTYKLEDEVVAQANTLAGQNGSAVRQHHSMDDLPQVDVVYTTRWQTMGVAHSDPSWRDNFWPYSVTQQVMDRVNKPSGTVFMHDLPAVRGEDVHDEVLDGPQSLAWRQARHKMFSAMSILEWCVNGDKNP